MRILEAEFATRLASGAATTCLCWRLTRADGFVLAVTEHDRALVVDGVTYQPGDAVVAGAFTNSAGLKPGQAAAGGALSHDAITEADLAAGLWDGAAVSETAFQAELVSVKADLERPVGRVYARRCDAALGDARCGVDVGAFPGVACDQRWETCRDTFANTVNFRGFPHMPGSDFVLAGPAGHGNDGGKR